MPRISLLTHFASKVNCLLDSGRASVSAEEMRSIIEEGRVFEYLKQFEPSYIDLALIDSDEKRNYFHRNLQQVALNLEGQGREKSGIENNGLCLLLAYLIELIKASTAGQEARNYSAF